MLAGSYVVLYVLIEHFIDLKTKDKATEELLDKNFIYSILLNIFGMFAGMVGFGRPYCPAFIYIIGVISIALGNKSITGYVQWTEKLFLLMSLLSLSFEYFYFCIQNRIRTNRKDRLFTMFILSVIVFIVVLLCRYN
jgi:hypothetical protein